MPDNTIYSYIRPNKTEPTSMAWEQPAFASIFDAINRGLESRGEQPRQRPDVNRRMPEQFVNESKLYDELEFDEGFRDKVYPDTEGHDTIGFGHKVRDGEDWSNGITREEARKLLEKDTLEARQGAQTLPYWNKLNDAQQRAVTNMVFNLGLEGFKGFKKTNKLLEAGKYQEASKEMLNSKWATQVGERANRLSQMVASR